MDIFNHFSCHTRLPVKLQDVQDHILETGVVDEIRIYPVDIDPEYLMGFCWVHRTGHQNGSGPRVIAFIGYSKHLPREWVRLVVCKELLHLLDRHQETAQTVAEVDQLIEEIVLPLDALIGIPTQSDHRGMLLAMAILLPRDAIDEFRTKVDEGQVSIETVAGLAQVPVTWARVMFSPVWKPVMEGFHKRFGNGGDQPGLPLNSEQKSD